MTVWTAAFSKRAFASVIRAGDSSRYSLNLKSHRIQIIEQATQPDSRAALDKMRAASGNGTIPYSYSIRKDDARDTTLSIPHPLNQIEIAGFYDKYAETLIATCARSDFALRRPTAIANVSTTHEISNVASPKTGIPHGPVPTGELDLSSLVSYFAYSKENARIHAEVINQKLLTELILLAENIHFKDRREQRVGGSIELFNILIAGAHIYGEEFVGARVIEEMLDELASRELSYFLYVTLKFCMLKNLPARSSALASLNQKVVAKLDGDRFQIESDAESYLLFCDYLSAPDVQAREKLRMFQRFFPGPLSLSAIEELQNWVGFVSWSDLRIDHILERKALRPVYAWV